MRTANDNNTAIYALDPRGFGPQRFMSLFEGVASDTGGQFFRSNDLTASLGRVVRESSGFYLLGYSPMARPLDGRFHKIRVRVKPSGLEVRARSGYWAPSVSEMESARKKAADATLPPDVQQALAELPSASARRAVDLWIGTAIQQDRPVVRLSWSARPPAAGNALAASVAVTATHGETTRVRGADRDGGGIVRRAARTAAGHVSPSATPRATSWTRKRGRSRVPDPASVAVDQHAGAVPDAERARISHPRSRASARAFPGREFARSDRLLIRFLVHGSAAAAATVTAKILSQWGKDLAELPLTRPPQQASTYEIDLPLSTIARGEFLISVTAGAGAERVRAFVPIRVSR